MSASSVVVDFKNQGLGGQSLVPATRTVTANGTGIDMQLTDGPCFAVLNVGTVTGTTPTLDVAIQESDDNSAFAPLSPAVAFTQVTATPSPATGITMINIPYRTKRYLRAVATIAGTTPSFPCSVTIFGSKKVAGSGGGVQL